MSTNTENQTTPEVDPQSSENDQNEANLAAKFTNYEERLKNDGDKIVTLENELKQKDNILSSLKARVAQLEKEVLDAQKFKAQHLKETEEVAVLKAKSEDTLTRAKDIIFEKTKVIKNQELQIQALNQQIDSLKEVVSITKDLLEIRNMEVKQLEVKIQCMEDRVGAEKERHDLMHKKLENMIRYNGELKREYETQLCLFSALRERYNERELARGVLDDAQQANRRVPDNAQQANRAVPDNAQEATTSTNDQVNGEEPKSDDTNKEV